ncbi:hypothetical protein PG999_009916 [Apiospora kogelbergensis]|uniref:Uncharacterized protein n=1 Tax=Apiospora kogelbergensis TaxID=1337665 RepID=A0AAW0QKH5_9PEZI
MSLSANGSDSNASNGSDFFTSNDYEQQQGVATPQSSEAPLITAIADQQAAQAEEQQDDVKDEDTIVVEEGSEITDKGSETGASGEGNPEPEPEQVSGSTEASSVVDPTTSFLAPEPEPEIEEQARQRILDEFAAQTQEFLN